MTTTEIKTLAYRVPMPVSARVTGYEMDSQASCGMNRRRRLRRTSAMAVLLTIIALAAGACSRDSGGSGGNGSGATPASSASGNSEMDQGVAFAKCMRENGLPEFKDPERGKGMGDGLDTNSEAFKKALDACKALMPGPTSGGGGPQAWSNEDKLKYAQCMRDNGVPNFPDPDANGGFRLEMGTDPTTPQFKAAETACAKYQPESLRNQAPNKPGGGS
jgi:hypothetical protein